MPRSGSGRGFCCSIALVWLHENKRTNDGVQVADTLAWLSDELRSECSQPVLQRARGIANHGVPKWRTCIA